MRVTKDTITPHHYVSFISVLLFIAVVTFTLPKQYASAAQARVPKLRNTQIISAPNSNYAPGHGRKIDTVVIHFMSAINVDQARWADPKLNEQILQDNGVSAHYLIDRAGTTYRLVSEQNVAWHAGGSIMPPPDNRRNVNSFSIGIELIATKDSGYTEAQYQALSTLLHDIKSRCPIHHIVGHDEISGSRAVRMGLRGDLKEDPGPLFDWSRVR